MKERTNVGQDGNQVSMFNFKDEKKKKIFTVCAIIYAILILLFVLIVNFDKFQAFGQWANDKFSVFTPIIVGAIIAYLCTPLVRIFQNHILKKMKNNHAKRTLSILLAYLSIVGIVIIFVALILPQLFSSAEEFLRKMTDGTYLNSTINSVNDFLNRILTIKDEERFEFIDVNQITNYIRNFFNDSGDLLQKIGNAVLSYASKFVVSLKNIFLGFLLSVYFVISKERIYAQSKKIMLSTMSQKKYDSLVSWARYADSTFGGFVVGKLIDAIFMTIICSIVFSIAGIPYAILISVLIGISNIIPFFGPFIGAIPSGFIVLIASDASKLLLFIILILVIQQIDGNILEPKIVGDKTGLSSLGVIVAVIVMGGYLGIIGTFFGVPIFAILCSFVKSFVDKRLKKKELATDIAEYYPKDSLVEPNEQHEGFNTRIYKRCQKVFHFLAANIKRFFGFLARKLREVSEKRKEKRQAPKNKEKQNKKEKHHK